MNKYIERVNNGIIKENPIFIMMLGMCPTLAVTTSASNGIGMGLSTTAVLVLSNLLISALRRFIPNKVRMPYYIVVVASFVTVVELVLKAYFPAVNESLGIYIPLIVVNCIIFGRVEAYAAKNSVGLSFFDGIGMGLGFTLALVIIGAFRELLGVGTLFGVQVTPDSFEPISIFVQAPGAFLVLAMVTAAQNKLQLPSATNKAKKQAAGCGAGCAQCSCDVSDSNINGIEEAKEVAEMVQSKAKNREKED